MASPPYEIRDIPGYEGKYQATSCGDIFSIRRNKFLTLGDDTYGYRTCSLESKTIKVHKIIALTFLDNPHNYIQVDHINRNRFDNNVSNLRYVSASENQCNKKPYARRPAELKHILVKKSTFKVKYCPKGAIPIYKSFKTLIEAQTFRDALIQKPPAQPDAP